MSIPWAVFFRAGYGRDLVLSDDSSARAHPPVRGQAHALFDARLVLRVGGVAVVCDSEVVVVLYKFSLCHLYIHLV